MPRRLPSLIIALSLAGAAIHTSSSHARVNAKAKAPKQTTTSKQGQMKIRTAKAFQGKPLTQREFRNPKSSPKYRTVSLAKVSLTGPEAAVAYRFGRKWIQRQFPEISSHQIGVREGGISVRNKMLPAIAAKYEVPSFARTTTGSFIPKTATATAAVVVLGLVKSPTPGQLKALHLQTNGKGNNEYTVLLTNNGKIKKSILGAPLGKTAEGLLLVGHTNANATKAHLPADSLSGRNFLHLRAVDLKTGKIQWTVSVRGSLHIPKRRSGVVQDVGRGLLKVESQRNYGGDSRTSTTLVDRTTGAVFTSTVLRNSF